MVFKEYYLHQYICLYISSMRALIFFIVGKMRSYGQNAPAILLINNPISMHVEHATRRVLFLSAWRNAMQRDQQIV